MSHLLSNNENKETKQYLASRLEHFATTHKIDVNKGREPNKRVGLNLATFNDAIEDDLMLTFLKEACE